jgi:hypothetical protein
MRRGRLTHSPAAPPLPCAPQLRSPLARLARVLPS